MFFAFSMQDPHHVSVLNRVVAKGIDLFIVKIVSVIFIHPLGPILGFIYGLLADGIHWGPFMGQSAGKKIMRLRVVHRRTGEPASLRDSVLRNLPIGVVTVFSMIPVWGWLILALLGIPLMAMEIYLMLSVEKGHRLGDVIGDTEVIEMKS